MDPVKLDSNEGDAIVEACRAWSLNARQVEEFFSISREYEKSPYSLFYYAPCSISGELQLGGLLWQYTIDGGATATLRQGGEVRYWGCSDTKCESLVVIATDLMNPE